MKNAGFTKGIYESTSEILKCDDNIQMTFPKIDNKTHLAIVTQDCSFPGSDVYYAMQGFYAYTKIRIEHRLEGWLSDYQIRQGFSNPGQLKVLAMDLNKQNNGYTRITGPLKLHLGSIYSEEDVEEWLEENIYERKRHNEEILAKVNGMLQIKVWPKRPLGIVKVEKQNNPQQQLKPNDSNPRMQKESQLVADQNIEGSKVIMDKSNIKRRQDGSFRPLSNLDNRDDLARLSQGHGDIVQKETGANRSNLSEKDQAFAPKSEQKYLKANADKNTKQLFLRNENDNVRLPAKNIGQMHGISKGPVRVPINELRPNYSLGENRNRQAVPFNVKPESGHNKLAESQLQKVDSQNQKNGLLNKYNVLNEKLKQRGNQMNENVQNFGNVLKPHYHKMVEADKSQDLKLLDESREFENIAKHRESNINKGDPDFKDSKMKLYEERLIKLADQYA